MNSIIIKKFQQGDLILKETKVAKKDFGKKLNHLILQQSDVSNHKHQITKGTAILYSTTKADEFYLDVTSDNAVLSHEEHTSINIPKGKYFVYGVKEFDPFEDIIRRVRD